MHHDWETVIKSLRGIALASGRWRKVPVAFPLLLDIDAPLTNGKIGLREGLHPHHRVADANASMYLAETREEIAISYR